MKGNSEIQLESESKGIETGILPFQPGGTAVREYESFLLTLYCSSIPIRRSGCICPLMRKVILICRHFSTFFQSTPIMHQKRGRCVHLSSVLER